MRSLVWKCNTKSASLLHQHLAKQFRNHNTVRLPAGFHRLLQTCEPAV